MSKPGWSMSTLRMRTYQALAIAVSFGLFAFLWWLNPPNSCTVTDMLTAHRCQGGEALTLIYWLLASAPGWGVVYAMYRIELNRMRRINRQPRALGNRS